MVDRTKTPQQGRWIRGAVQILPKIFTTGDDRVLGGNGGGMVTLLGFPWKTTGIVTLK